MKKSFLFIVVLFISISFCTDNFAQGLESDYKTAVGAKVFFGNGTSGGFNFKSFIKPDAAIEASFIFFEGPIVGLDALYLFHGDINDAPGLKWYAGGGGLFMFVTESGYSDNFGFALRPVIGLDYKFKGAPISVAIDANPIFNLVPATEVQFALGLSFRYVIN